jgi:hypothetical protein
MRLTVIFEATSKTTFKAEPGQFAMQVCELNTLDLEGRDEGDLHIVEMGIFLNQRPVQAHAARIHMQSAYEAS